jgi:hypothetical protein
MDRRLEFGDIEQLDGMSPVNRLIGLRLAAAIPSPASGGVLACGLLLVARRRSFLIRAHGASRGQEPTEVR